MHSSKAPTPIFSVPGLRFTNEREVHPWKAKSPTSITYPGIVKKSSSVHSLKAPSPMDLTVVGMSTSDIPMHPLKASVPMETTAYPVAS